MRISLLLSTIIIGCASADSDVQYVKGVKGGYGARYHKGDTNYLRFYNNTQVETTTYDPSDDVGVCYTEVPTINLVSDPTHVPAGNGSRPELSRIRTCCKGYIRNEHNYKLCDPVCTKECINANCVAPDTCKCFPDHVKNLAGSCVATCPIGCQNGRCAGGECICNDGYKLDSDSKFCVPSCKDNCNGLGNCTAPHTCECKHGYHSTPEGSCQATCNRCDNGVCSAPNECRCHPGYSKDQRGICVPQCNPSCGTGSNCIAPNACSRHSNSPDNTQLHITPITTRPLYPMNQIQNGSDNSDYGRGDIESNNQRHPGQRPEYQYTGYQQHNINLNNLNETSNQHPYYRNPYNPQRPNSYPSYERPNNTDGQGPNSSSNQGSYNPQYSINQYPYNQHPNNQYPNNQYPNNQYPNNEYPNNQYPNSQYPNNQYPNSQYPNNQYPNSQYPNSQYPNNQYPNSQYPYNQHPNNQNQNTTYQKPTYPSSSPKYGSNYPSNQGSTPSQYPKNTAGHNNTSDNNAQQSINNPLYPNQINGGINPNARPSHEGPYRAPNQEHPVYGYPTEQSYSPFYPMHDNRPLNPYNQVGPDQTRPRNGSHTTGHGSYYTSNQDQEQEQQTAELVPVCSRPCVNSHCVEGNECRCNPGYIPDRTDPGRCLPNCPGGCPNGVCSAPHLCLCNAGYFKDTSVKGRQICIKR
ncbi:uncharacterized protein ACR2FA_009282 [Aphomia sociella]